MPRKKRIQKSPKLSTRKRRAEAVPVEGDVVRKEKKKDLPVRIGAGTARRKVEETEDQGRADLPSEVKRGAEREKPDLNGHQNQSTHLVIPLRAPGELHGSLSTRPLAAGGGGDRSQSQTILGGQSPRTKDSQRGQSKNYTTVGEAGDSLRGGQDAS